jgi:hypothetical protein
LPQEQVEVTHSQNGGGCSSALRGRDYTIAYSEGEAIPHPVRAAAAGAVVGMAAGAMSINKDDTTYYLSGNTWFKPAYGASGVYHAVVPTP